MALPALDPLDPLAPLREFDVGGFHIIVRQRVTGDLEYVVCADGKVLVTVKLPVGFDVDDAEYEAREALAPRHPR